MKHITSFLIPSILIFSLTACGVSQEEHNALLNENSSLKTELESLSSEKESLSSEKESLSSQIESLSSEKESLSSQIQSLLDYKENQVLSTMNDSYIKAWATTAFGDNSLCFFNDNSHFQCIAEKTYSISEEGISKLWEDVLLAAQTLTYMQLTYPDKITYETIAIKFYDPSNIYILEVMMKRNDESYILDSIVCNFAYSSKIIPILTNLILD